MGPCSRGVAPPFATVRSEATSVCRRRSVFLMDWQVLFSLALCANRSFSSSTCRFATQAQCFGRLCVLVAAPVGFAIQGGRFEVSWPLIVFAPAPFVQSARFGGPETCQHWTKSFWRHSPVLVLDACRKRVKVGFRLLPNLDRILTKFSRNSSGP